MSNGVSIYPLESERLTIRPLGDHDMTEFVAYRSDPNVARWQSWDVNYSLTDAERLLSGQPRDDLPEPGNWLQLAVHTHEDDRLCGDVAVHRLSEQPNTFEIGMTMAPWAQGRGIGTEAGG